MMEEFLLIDVVYKQSLVSNEGKAKKWCNGLMATPSLSDGKMEGGAFARLRLVPYIAFVHFDDFPANRQPDACAGAV
jgi:hypothetical protein